MSGSHQVREGLWGDRYALTSYADKGHWYARSGGQVLACPSQGLCPVHEALSASGLVESEHFPGTFLLPLAFFVTT